MREYTCKIKSCGGCPAHQWNEKNQSVWCYKEDKEISVEFFGSFPEFCKLKIITKERGVRINIYFYIKRSSKEQKMDFKINSIMLNNLYWRIYRKLKRITTYAKTT